MIGMAHDLGYRVVAEGVESEAALTCLDELGCNEVQGYLLARPLLPSASRPGLPGRRDTTRLTPCPPIAD
ncbi:EAL domain-containing protein [Halomonas ventosae]|uniref:EAL domain-containing protein n=2 Tax=Halomonas ventosae TaxID=229007 RepID=A0A2T0VND7_9GAMM|nr:EAL domain-containing protein [Halomonas ventosae]